MSDPLALRVLRYLPRNLISRAFGRFAALERPRFFVRRVKRWFAAHFGIDLSEADRPLDDYPSLLAFFTRELKEGARTIAADPAALVSPVDARLGTFGRIAGGELLQAKGMSYGLEALLGSAAEAARFADGSYATLYLSPRDYHRIHAPRTGTVSRSLYEPGTLWPVNPPACRTIPSLFAVNERVTTVLETDRGPIAVVMVGATNVGSIRLAYDDFVANRGGRRATLEPASPVTLARGDHLGTFELGSTVILLVADPSFAWEGFEEGAWYGLGTPIGRFGSAARQA